MPETNIFCVCFILFRFYRNWVRNWHWFSNTHTHTRASAFSAFAQCFLLFDSITLRMQRRNRRNGVNHTRKICRPCDNNFLVVAHLLWSVTHMLLLLLLRVCVCACVYECTMNCPSYLLKRFLCEVFLSIFLCCILSFCNFIFCRWTAATVAALSLVFPATLLTAMRSSPHSLAPWASLRVCVWGDVLSEYKHTFYEQCLPPCVCACLYSVETISSFVYLKECVLSAELWIVCA